MVHHREKRAFFGGGGLRSQKILPSTLYIMSPINLKLLRPTVWKKVQGYKKFHFLDHKCCLVFLHYVTDAPAILKLATTSNGLGGDAFTRIYII